MATQRFICIPNPSSSCGISRTELARIACKIFAPFCRGIPNRDRTNGSLTSCFNSSLDKTRLQLGSTVFAKQRNQACLEKPGIGALASIEMPISLSSIASIPIQFRQSIRTAPQKIQEPQLPHGVLPSCKGRPFPTAAPMSSLWPLNMLACQVFLNAWKARYLPSTESRQNLRFAQIQTCARISLDRRSRFRSAAIGCSSVLK